MGAAEISDRQIRADREVSDLALRTRLCDPKDFGGKYPGGQTVRIRTRQGQTLVASRKQTSNEPFSKAELIAKFEENAAFSGICPPPRAVAMLQAIERLDQCDDVSQFVRRHLINP